MLGIGAANKTSWAQHVQAAFIFTYTCPPLGSGAYAIESSSLYETLVWGANSPRFRCIQFKVAPNTRPLFREQAAAAAAAAAAAESVSERGNEVHMMHDVLSPVVFVHGERDHFLDKEVVEWRLSKLLHQYHV